jgi:hypothetical protein
MARRWRHVSVSFHESLKAGWVEMEI